jgi:hypothetical protein
MYFFFFSSIVNHHLVESKENQFRPSTATTILDILKVDFCINHLMIYLYSSLERIRSYTNK